MATATKSLLPLDLPSLCKALSARSPFLRAHARYKTIDINSTYSARLAGTFIAEHVIHHLNRQRW